MQGGSAMDQDMRAADGGGGGAAAGSPAPPSQAGDDLALALDRFIQDSAAMDAAQWKAPATTSAHTATSTLNGVPRTTSDEISRLL